mmetsp:Transcript_11132/g.17643  ORF Transcript_11132/g.17643 Transcript_11132/m.17643 type:complete len:269 (-) Transcript_11132:1173-1979(-)
MRLIALSCITCCILDTTWFLRSSLLSQICTMNFRISYASDGGCIRRIHFKRCQSICVMMPPAARRFSVSSTSTKLSMGSTCLFSGVLCTNFMRSSLTRRCTNSHNTRPRAIKVPTSASEASSRSAPVAASSSTFSLIFFATGRLSGVAGENGVCGCGVSTTVLGEVPSAIGASESGSIIPLMTKSSTFFARSSFEFRLTSSADISATHCEIPMPVAPILVSVRLSFTVTLRAARTMHETSGPSPAPISDMRFSSKSAVASQDAPPLSI